MSSLSALLVNIKQVLIDLKSDRANTRAHSLESFHSIFDNRSSDLYAILRSNQSIRNDDEADSFTWSNLFDGLHDAIKDQCVRINACKSSQSQKTLMSKNDGYKEALRKCINVANEQVPNVPYRKICSAAFDCFETPSICEHFDALYLQIVHKHILNARHDIGELNNEDWSRILSYMFDLFDRRNTQIQKLELLQCIPLILQHGSKYTYLVNHLHQYLPNIVRMVNEGQLHNQINAQKQILLIVYEFIRNLAINQRLSIVGFTESVLEKILKLYQFTMDTDSKVMLMKIMHISIIVHSPEPISADIGLDNNGTSDRTNNLFRNNLTDDALLWNKHLRNMLSVIEREITDSRKRSNRLNPTLMLCPIFVRMAAKLCSVIYWNDDVWLNGSGSDEQQQKKRRHSMKLERILELIEFEPSKYCWRWFAILSQLLVDFPHVLQAEDYQSLLKLLFDFKPTILHPLQMKCFNRIAEVMLSKELELKQSSTQIMESFCTKHWHEIMELSFKQAETDKTQLENVELLRIMIDNKVFVSHDFIKNIIIAVAKMQTIKKSNSSIRLLTSVLCNVNTDMIEGIHELKIAIIQWLSSKIKLTELKKVIENNNTIDKHLVSELYVLCVLARQDNTCKRNGASEVVQDDDAAVHEYEKFIAELVQSLQYRMLSKLVVSNEMHASVKNDFAAIERLPERKDVKTSQNEALFAELETAINDANTSDDSSTENFNNICASLMTNVNVLNSLVGYEAMDGDNFRKFLTKRIFFKISQLVAIVDKFGDSFRVDRNPNDVNEVIDGLLSVWHDKYHPIIAQNIFIVQNSASIIKWLQKQLKPSQRDRSIVLLPLKMASQLSFEERIQLKCLTLLANFSEYTQDDSLDVFEAITNYTFNYKRNEDLFIALELIEIIFNQRCPSEEEIEWAFDELKEICEKQKSNCDYMELIVDRIPALIKCVKSYTDSEMLDDLITLISIVLKLCKKKKFGMSVSIKIIKCVQFFAQELFDIEDGFQIIAFMMHFLHSECYNIQLATVSCLTNIFNKKWLNYNEDEVSCLKIQQFHVDLEKNLKIGELTVAQQNDNDRKTCIASVRMQIYCSLIGICYPLRKITWFGLIEFCRQQLELNEAKTYEIIGKLCGEVFHSTTTAVLADLLPYLISLWIDKEYLLTKFPIKLSKWPKQNDFVVEYMETITLRIIQYKSNLIPGLLQMAQADSLSDILTTPILVKSLAWLTSANVTDDGQRKAKAVKMLSILKQNVPHIENYFESHSLEIIQELITTLFDAEKFTQCFGTDVEYVSDESTIDFGIFMKSLDYVKKKSSKPSDIIHHFCALSPRKVIKILYSLKLVFQGSMSEELKLTQMFRVCVLIDIIVDFLIENANQPDQVNVIGFFVRDFVFFFGNTISSECTDKLKLATCKYFHQFCQKILPACATYFQIHLNYIVSILMPIVKVKQQTKIVDAGMGLLHFLIVDQTNVLRQAIGQLDSFPAQHEFDQMRQIQSDVKYNGKTWSLLDEIEYFLLVEKRKVEGLLSLKEHLSKKKSELREIYKTIYDTRGFSEDCEKSPIHRLIDRLLSQIVQNVDAEKSVIAAKCLGELGPSDLGSIALRFDVKPQTYKVCKSFDEAVTNLCELALEKLNGIFIHSDATVLAAAALACEHMLQSNVAVSFLDKYPLLAVFETGAVTQLPLKQRDDEFALKDLFKDEAFAKAHSFWVKSLAIELFKFFGGESLASVAAQQTPFSVAMIPLLIKTLLTTKNKNHNDALNTAVNRFFSKTFERLVTEPMEIDSNMTEVPPVYLNKVSIKLMLNVVECIRIHNQNSSPEERLKLNYLHIAKAALFCEAFFTAILYGELASCDESSDINADEIRSIMKCAYQSIGETDAVSAFLDPIKQRIEYLELNRCWDQIFIGMDAQANEFPQYVRFLGQAGLYNLANKLTQGGNATNYECAWRLADWNIIEGDAQRTQIQGDGASADFDKYHYFALKNLQQRDQIGVKINVEHAFKAIVKMFKQSSYECTKNIYKNLMMLHLLQQVDEFCHIQFPSTDEVSYGPEFIINKWKYQDEIASCGFSYREPILAQRVIMFGAAGLRAKRKIENVCKISDGIQQMILNLVTECREEGFFNLGERYSAKLQAMDLSREMKFKVLIEDAQLNWCRGDGEMAQHMIATVIKGKTPTFTHSKALGMMGEYLADARLEDVNTIIKSYLMESIMFATRLEQKTISVGSVYYYPPEEKERLYAENKKRNYQAIAKYADREYQRIAAYKKSTEFEKKLSNIRKNRAVAHEMNERCNTLTNDEKKSLTLLRKTVTIDDSDVKSTNTEYEQYLQLAIEHYIQSLLLETENEMSGSAIFRLFGLWFSNINNKEILKEIDDNYKNIATYKFISLMPQITTHLGTDGIKDVIQDIVAKCAAHHPHHVLPKVMALFNAFKDEIYVSDSKQKSKNVPNSPRTDAATKLLQELKGNSGLRDIIVQMERMWEVLIRLANTKIEGSKEFSSKEPIRHLRDLNFVHCPTVNLPIKVSGDYSQSIVGINKWKSTFSVANGINAPKRIECIGSNGQQYSQLLKGTDDLRQDAVMQQVFNIMNDMLVQSKVTKKDRLHVRTYIIVPLSQRSGILEWCENTMPLTDYLVGSSRSNKGAHERFRPEDWPPQECRKRLSQVSIRATTFDNTYKTYKSICDHIKPVFHHFFLEHFSNPGVWFERRMAYAHSLATTSMIGYILGIGDRHVSNILIDKTTAELIHIDFGIAFEQGKCLPTPELIPFRLTRDLVSALGPSGVEGVYRKSCEKTMEVLRQNRQTILTIVEVLLHDPLYAWTLTSNQANKRQQTTVQIDEDQDINTMAERALWRLEEKLDGKHVSRSEAIPVKRHVEILIKEATNDKLLCKLFVGWQPYL